MTADQIEQRPVEPQIPALVVGEPHQRVKVRLGRSVSFIVGVAWLAILITLALIIDWLPVASYDAIVGPPFLPLFSPEAWLGTDSIGRSIFPRVIYGARISLTIGFVAALIGVLIGGILGMVAGYFRGLAEAVVDVLAEVVQAFPAMLFLVALSAAMRPTVGSLTITMGILMIPVFARITKGAVLAQTGKEFVVAAKAQGAGPLRIILREVFPNTLISLISFTVMTIALLIVVEGSVSFLGYGIPAPQPSWGGMIAESQSQLANYPSVVITPIAFLFFTVFALNAIGDWLRKRFDVGQAQL